MMVGDTQKREAPNDVCPQKKYLLKYYVYYVLSFSIQAVKSAYMNLLLNRPFYSCVL